MLRVCLDVESLALLASAADFARAETPDVTRSCMPANMTPLQKMDGGVRGRATGTSFRRQRWPLVPLSNLLCLLEQAWIVWGTL